MRRIKVYILVRVLLTQADVRVIERRRAVTEESIDALFALIADCVMPTLVATRIADARVVRAAVRVLVALALCSSDKRQQRSDNRGEVW